MNLLKITRLSLLLHLVYIVFGDHNIRYAAIIYRHGDRTPVDPYPTDPWRDPSFWPVKFGELTNIGINQHFALGSWFRVRYSHLLSDKFDPSEIYVKSTDVDRTLMSAQANLAGLYPPEGTSVWNKNLMWRPIPVHTTPEKEDHILAMNKKCDAYELEMRELINSQPYKDRLRKYESLMTYITIHTGRLILNYSDIEYIYNTLKIEELYNFTLPAWTKRVYPKKMKEPACYSFILPTFTETMARLKVGPLIKEITNNMLSLNNSNNTQRLSMYSAHDDTIGSILNALGLFNVHCPEYTSAVMFELLYDNTTESNSTQYNVRISYRNSTALVEPLVLRIPKCGQLCPIEEFHELYSNIMPENWESECETWFSRWANMAFPIGFLIILVVYMIRLQVLQYKLMEYKFQKGIHYGAENYVSINSID